MTKLVAVLPNGEWCEILSNAKVEFYLFTDAQFTRFDAGYGEDLSIGSLVDAFPTHPAYGVTDGKPPPQGQHGVFAAFVVHRVDENGKCDCREYCAAVLDWNRNVTPQGRSIK